jgi:hypothetical protein
MRGDRMSAYEQFDLSLTQAMRNEFNHGLNAIAHLNATEHKELEPFFRR